MRHHHDHQRPTPSILRYVADPALDVIIVADRKIPEESSAGLDCEFLSLARQRELAPAFDALLPFNHYSRKNMGYIWAARKGYECLIETNALLRRMTTISLTKTGPPNPLGPTMSRMRRISPR